MHPTQAPEPEPSAPVRHVDPLTGLANRVGLEQFLSERESRLAADEAQEAPGTRLSLMTMEISRFGSVNDSMGAELGNKVIVTVAKRLNKLFGHAALIARTHGDHLCLVFEGPLDLHEQMDLLKDFTQRPLALRGEVIVLSVRLGLAVLGEGVDRPTRLLHAAEVALHRAKRQRLKHAFYHREFEADARAQHQLENDLRVSLVTHHAELHQAIVNDEFHLLYQPIVDVSRQRVHAFEALIRWHHPKRGVIAPVQFIPMAEQIQIMDVLGSWILRRACLDAMTFPANPDGSLPGISINVSPSQFIESAVLVQAVEQALQESGIDPRRVSLEITESMAIGEEQRAVVEQLRAMGCRVALDDFGTGYASLSQLNHFPLDVIKLDRSLIEHLGGENPVEDQRSDRMTRAVVSIAASFELVPVIEGVETERQSSRLKALGAHLQQGYFFAKPMTLDDARDHVARCPSRLEGSLHV